jgi:hypothetical protein
MLTFIVYVLAILMSTGVLLVGLLTKNYELAQVGLLMLILLKMEENK